MAIFNSYFDIARGFFRELNGGEFLVPLKLINKKTWLTIFQGLWTLLKSCVFWEQPKLWPSIVALLFARESKYT
jgi:hypothetical protein